ncbi:MAG: Isoaspartyl peptidase or L-asparaginase, Ntn-hydrolase superfamily [Sporanaerobacter sp.]|jgi:isoaspartyl peptidase/L-asparaginase-like protein (Ntn-hydrolase superfamily)|uniref:N(4)-(beta-N-acetylglucosaminyl)-L-asparaginase n=1 Tax=Sporanaerobacter sp. TaxID=2010183 RepID=UPI003A0FD722
MWGIIATWAMAYDGVSKGSKLLVDKHSAVDAIEETIKSVEDEPSFRSVGYGGLPNEKGIVELDSGFMDGDKLSVGAVGGITGFKNPISIAIKLSEESYNNFLVGSGAEEYARLNGFEEKDMSTERSLEIWREKKKRFSEENIKAYDGHDTVGVVTLDTYGKMCVGTSTSGLFMKREGRIGDSPLCGGGFYVDSEVGGAAATGVGEDIMKGCLSYEVVRLMKEGLNPQEAAERAVAEFSEKLKRKANLSRDISVVCMNNKGEWGIGTNIDEFSFVVAKEGMDIKAYIVKRQKERIEFVEATNKWIDKYMKKEIK